MKWWQKMIANSSLVSGLIALGLVGTACVMWMQGQDVPKELFALLGTIVGFFFGTRAGSEQERVRELVRK